MSSNKAGWAAFSGSDSVISRRSVKRGENRRLIMSKLRAFKSDAHFAFFGFQLTLGDKDIDKISEYVSMSAWQIVSMSTEI